MRVLQQLYKTIKMREALKNDIFIGPESDHWECLSVTNSLTDCCLVNLIDVTLVACEDDNSSLLRLLLLLMLMLGNV